MTRPFAYNPSLSPISGTIQIGDLAIGNSSLDYSSRPGGIDWWMGPEEDLGYVIATSVSSGDFPTPLGNIGTVQFWRTSSLDPEEFRVLSEIITGQSFIDEESAKTYLNSNGYWTSWVSSYSYNSLSLLSWPSSTSGYTKYSGSVTSPDDGFSSTPIALPVSFSVNNLSSSNLYVSTNGYVTLGSGSGSIINTPQQIPNPGTITGNPSDQWLQFGLVMTDGDTQDIYYQTNSEGGGKYNIKLIVYQGTYGATTTPKSYLLNIYRDSVYQWVETRAKLNVSGRSGPYNSIDVSQPSSTQSRIWRGDLNGQNWSYLGTGSVI